MITIGRWLVILTAWCRPVPLPLFNTFFLQQFIGNCRDFGMFPLIGSNFSWQYSRTMRHAIHFFAANWVSQCPRRKETAGSAIIDYVNALALQFWSLFTPTLGGSAVIFIGNHILRVGHATFQKHVKKLITVFLYPIVCHIIFLFWEKNIWSAHYFGVIKGFMENNVKNSIVCKLLFCIFCFLFFLFYVIICIYSTRDANL